MSARTYLGFLPWIVFALIARQSLEGVAWGGVAAVLTAGAIAIGSARTRSVKELEIFSLALFFALAVAGALNQHDPQGFLQRYHNGLAVGALACFAVASLAFQPFTERTPEELVQRKYWNTNRFNRANVELTLMWAAVFVAIAGSQIAAGAHRDPPRRHRSSTGSLPIGLDPARRPAGDAAVDRPVRRASRWASTRCSTRSSSGIPARAR